MSAGFVLAILSLKHWFLLVAPKLFAPLVTLVFTVEPKVEALSQRTRLIVSPPPPVACEITTFCVDVRDVENVFEAPPESTVPLHEFDAP